MIDRLILLILVFASVLGVYEIYKTQVQIRDNLLVIEEQLWIVLEYNDCTSRNGEWDYDTGCHLEEYQ